MLKTGALVTFMMTTMAMITCHDEGVFGDEMMMMMMMMVMMTTSISWSNTAAAVTKIENPPLLTLSTPWHQALLTYAVVGYLRSIFFLAVDEDDDVDDDEDEDGDGIGDREGFLRKKREKRLTLEEMQKVPDDRKSPYSQQRTKKSYGVL
eukprot:jgi/Bigna1/128744/aug1.7_g3452